jgi:hypothetical protein
MLRSQRYDLHPMAGKETAGTDEQDLEPLSYKARKSLINVINVADIEDLNFSPNSDGLLARPRSLI